LLRISAPDYEFRNLRRLARKGIRVPQPYGLCRISGKGKQFTEALFLEDLGETTSATEHIKRLISDGQENIVQAFEDQLIEMTRTMVSAGIVDTDLLLVNIVVPKTGEPVRLDLELARLVFFPRLFWRRYARMIGQLIGSHAFAVQPEVSRTTDFASRLARRMHPPIRVLRHAARHVRAMMADQARDAHIHTRVELPW
jgi:Lipopolysaccharide kinase (Kdo/WaaP) family